MKIVGITSCSTGIAHTYMAAESLEIAAKKRDIEIKVETQGSIGAENVLTEQEIAEADAVIIAASTSVNKDRFNGKRLLEVDVTEAIDHPDDLFDRVPNAAIYTTSGEVKTEAKAEKSGIYSHLMTGVSYMIPFVVAGGICIALAFAFGGINAKGDLAAAINELGGIAMGLMWPILGGYVAFSIADRPGLVPGMVAGMIASNMNAGFLGALLGGFLAGYTVQLLKKVLKLPPAFSGLLPVLILPVISVLFVGLIMKFVVGIPITALNEGITNWLNSLSGMNSVLLAMALSSTVLGKGLYSKEEREAGKSAWVLGLSFISEGAIPFAAADPIRVLASVTVGSAITGALSMIFNCGIAVPHGGFFVFLIPGAVENVLLYVLALAIGTAISGFLVTAVKVMAQKKQAAKE